MVFAAATPGMPSFKTAAPSTGYGLASAPSGWGAASQLGIGSQPMPTPEQQSMQQGLNLAYGLGAPQLASLNQQYGTLQGQLGTTQAGYDLARQAAQSDAAAQLAKTNLGPEYDAVTRAAIQRQLAGLGVDDNLAFQMLGNQFKGLDLQRTQAWQGAGRAQTAAKTDATARGSIGSVGFNKKMTGIQQDLANQLSGIDINRTQDTLQAQQAQNDRREAAAKLKDQNAMLDIKAKEYGLDRNQIKANLQQGLAKLGIDNMATVNQILDMMSSNDVQQRAVAEQIFRQGMEYSNFFTTLPQNTLPVGGGVGGASGNNPVAGQAVDEFMGRGATYHG